MNKTMKKWFALSLMLLAGIGTASAQKLVIDDFVVKAGEAAELTLNLVSGDGNTIYGFQTDIELPDGLTMKEEPAGIAACMADGSDAAFAVNLQEDGTYRIAAFSLAGVAFKAETAVAKFTVKAAADFSNEDGLYAFVECVNTKFTVDAKGTELAGPNTLAEADAALFTYPTLPQVIDFMDTTPVLDGSGIVTYAADITGLQVSGMQPVKGWDAVSNGDGRAAGVFEAGSTAFLGSSGFFAPATDSDGGATPMVGILAVWNTTAQYTQKVFFKAGEYYLTFNVFNAGGTADIAKNLIGFVAEDGTEYFAETTAYPVGEWTQEQLRIVLKEDTYGFLSMGYTAQDLGKADNPHLFFQGVKLQSEIFPSNYRAYTFKCDRGYLGVRGATLVSTKVYAGEATDFAVITYNEKTYLYSISANKFVKFQSAGNVTAGTQPVSIDGVAVLSNYAPEPIDFSEWASGGYHLAFNGKTINVGDSYFPGMAINGWHNADGGNVFSVESVGDFDPTAALAILDSPEAAPAVTSVPVSNLSGLKNDKAYTVYGLRSQYWTVSGDTLIASDIKAQPNETLEQFAILQSGGNYYLWSISAKKFLVLENDRFGLSEEPQAIEILETGNTDYPFFFRYNEGRNVNFNGVSCTSRIIIDGWSSADEGNRYAISEVGDYDASEALAKLPTSIGDGEYVFQNVGCGLFLFGGNNWGTRASLTQSSQYLILHELEDGKFNIESMQNNGGESYWVGWGNASKDDIYVDATIDRAIAFSFEAVGEGIYNIKTDDDRYLYYEEGTTIVAFGDEAPEGDAAVWTITSVSDMLKNASEDAPVNATYLIKDADFDRNNRWNSDAEKDFGKAWTMTAANQNMSGGTNENKCAESWHSTFEMKQTIAGAPKGVYKLSAQGFYRDDSEGNLKKLPVLYANEFESEFPEILDETLNGNSIRNQGVAQMSDASNWFAAGRYPIEPIYFELTAAGDITLGVKYQEPELLWAIWDKFDLVYYGEDADIVSVQIEGRDVKLAELIKEAEALAAEDIAEDINLALGHAIETGKDAQATVPATKEVYQAAIDELEAAIAAAKGYFAPVNIYSSCGSYYDAKNADVDIAAILAKLGVESLDQVTIAAVQSDGTYDTDYKLGTTDGWRNAAGDWQAWGDDAYFYVKADFTRESAQLYEVGGYPGKTDEPVTFTATYSFKAGENEVILKVNLIYEPAPVIAYEFADLNVIADADVDIVTMVGGSYEGLQGDVDVPAILAALGVSSLDDVTIMAVQSDGSLDPDYSRGVTDGWRNAAGDWQSWGDAAYFYVKADFTRESAQLYEVGGYPGKTDNEVTYVATYAFVKNGSVTHDAIVLKVNLIYNNGRLVDPQEQYDAALENIEAGKAYRIFTVVDDVNYYLTEDGTLTSDAEEAGLFTPTKVAGEEWPYGFQLKSSDSFSNPANADSFNAGGLNKYAGGPRTTWEAQVFFYDGISKYAIRSTNAAYATSSWGLLGSAYWDVYASEDGPNAGYNYDKKFLWQVEKYVDERLEAFNMIQAWPAIIQEQVGLVQDAGMYSSNATDPVEGSLANLLDNDYQTFFHSTWHSTYDNGYVAPQEEHYLQAELPSAVSEFSFYFKKRSQNNDNRPIIIDIAGSNDGINFKDITSLANEDGDDLPTDGAVIFYQSENITMKTAYKYIRFTIIETNNGANTDGFQFFTFSEFYILPGNQIIQDAAEWYGVTDYKSLTDEDVAAIKALDEKVKNLKDAIRDINANMNLDNNAIYDLSGRKVNKVQKGIYIVNGKKVAIK